MQATDVHAEQWSAWDTGISNMTDNPWAPALDGSWTGPAADAGAERAQRLDVYMSKFSDATKTMKTITEAQQAADERWAQAPTEAEVRKAEALWLIAKNSDATNAAALEKEYLALKDEYEAEWQAFERACEDTKTSVGGLELPIVPDESGKEPPADGTSESGEDEDDTCDCPEGECTCEEGDGGGRRGDGEGEGEPSGTANPTDTTPTSPTPTAPSTTAENVTSPSAPSTTAEPTVYPPRTELSSDPSASNAVSNNTPKVFPSTQQPTAQPTMTQPAAQQVMMQPAAPAAQQPAQTQQQSYRPVSPVSPSPSPSTQRDNRPDADPVGMVGAPVPVHAAPIAHAPMPGSTVSSPSTNLSSASSAPTGSGTPGTHAPTGTPPVGGVPGNPVGAGNKATTNTNGRTPIYAADQPPTPNNTVPGGNVSAANEKALRDAEDAELAALLQRISDRRAGIDKGAV